MHFEIQDKNLYVAHLTTKLANHVTL